MTNYQRIIWIGLAVAAIAILALGYFLFLAPAGEKKGISIPETTSLPEPRRPVAESAEAENEPAVVPLDLELDRSDEAVRQLLAAAEIPATMKKWLQQKNIVRTVVAAIDSVAAGESPAALLPFLAPADEFPILHKGGKIYMDPRGCQRYDSLVGAFTAVPDRLWVVWYKTLHPTLEKAFKELGYPDVTFAQRVRQAVAQLTPALPPANDIELEKKMVSYAFANADLENLNPARKHLLRLGPVNAARVQKKLSSLATALKLPREKQSPAT